MEKPGEPSSNIPPHMRLNTMLVEQKMSQLPSRVPSGVALLPFYTPALREELLLTLLQDASVEPAVTAAMQTLLPMAIPAFIAAIRVDVEAASSRLHPASERKQSRISMDEHVHAMSPFLRKVRDLLALRVSGVSAKLVHELLLSVVKGSMPTMNNSVPFDSMMGRAVFDAEADKLMLELVIRRKGEEGVWFKAKEAAKELEDMQLGLLDTKEAKTWFPHTMALLRSWSKVAHT